MAIIGLLRSGYSAEQIVRLVVISDSSLEGFPLQDCAVLVDPDGDGPVLRVKGGEFATQLPAHAPAPECAEAVRKRVVESEPATSDTANAAADAAANEPAVWEGEFSGYEESFPDIDGGPQGGVRTERLADGASTLTGIVAYDYIFDTCATTEERT